MTGIFVIPPIPLTSNLTKELFHLTYLSSPLHEDPSFDTSFTFISFLDRFIGLMRIPYLYIESRRIYRAVHDGESFWDSSELPFQSLSVLANIAEILLWFHGCQWTELTPKMISQLTVICYLFRMILYEHAVVQESQALYLYKKAQKTYPQLDIERKKEYQLVRLQFMSHISYLTWMSMSFIIYVKEIPYPRAFLRLVQFSSFIFGILSMQYEDEPIFDFQIQKFLPNPNIYDR